jgi:hypothetical protein
MDYVFAVMTVVAGFIFITIMATGAFFSRPVGTKLGGAGAVAAGIAIWGGVAYGLPWWMIAPACLLQLANLLLGIAALGGER